MPATLTIKTTRNGAKAIDYSSARNGKDRAHNGYEMDRVLRASGVECTPQNGKKMMQLVWTQKRTKRKKMIEAYTIVQSFDPENFDYKNDKDLDLANSMGQELVEEVVPGRLALVYTQADGTHHVIHNHIIVCSQDPDTLKAMHGKQTMFKTWAKANDEILKSHGYEPLAEIKGKYATAKEKISRAEIGASQDKVKVVDGKPAVVKKGIVTRTEKIKQRIETILSDRHVTTWEKFQEVANENDLDVHIRKNKQGKINGLSYKLLDDPEMKRGIRAKRLGSIYMKGNIDDVFRSNSRDLLREETERERRRNQETERNKREFARKQLEAETTANFERERTKRALTPSSKSADLIRSAKSTLELLRQQSEQPQQSEASDFLFDDGPSLFDFTQRAKRKSDRANQSDRGKTLAEQAREFARQNLIYSKEQFNARRQLDRASTGTSILFGEYSKGFDRFKHLISRYYRRSIEFVQRHLSACRHLFRNFDSSEEGPSGLDLRELDEIFRNGGRESDLQVRSPEDSRPTGRGLSEDLADFKDEDAFADATEAEFKQAVGSDSEQPTQPTQPKQKTQPSEPKKRKYLDVDDDD